jgi:hypothetical protein
VSENINCILRTAPIISQARTAQSERTRNVDSYRARGSLALQITTAPIAPIRRLQFQRICKETHEGCIQRTSRRERYAENTGSHAKGHKRAANIKGSSLIRLSIQVIHKKRPLGCAISEPAEGSDIYREHVENIVADNFDNRGKLSSANSSSSID